MPPHAAISSDTPRNWACPVGGAVAPRGARKTDPPGLSCSGLQSQEFLPLNQCCFHFPDLFNHQDPHLPPGRMGGWEGWKQGRHSLCDNRLIAEIPDPALEQVTEALGCPFSCQETGWVWAPRRSREGNIETFYKPHWAALQPGWRLISPQPLPSPGPGG